MSSKLREALSDACYAMFNFLKTQYGNRYEEMAKALDKAKAALAEPLLNCEVGTAEEQEDRFADFCRKHECTMNCPIKKKWSGHKPSCGILWSQMPYEKGGEE
jgi:hypothetical protein